MTAPTYFAADLATVSYAEWFADLSALRANGRRVDVEGTTVTFTQGALDILSTLGDEDDGHFDGGAIWIQGIGYTVRAVSDGLPLGVTLEDLAREVVADRGIEMHAALDVVRTTVDQISDDPTMWDADRGIEMHAALDVVRTTVDQISDDPTMWDADRQMVIGEGVTVVRDAMAVDLNSTVEDLMLEELAEIPGQVEVLEDRRGELVRALMKTSVRRAKIAEAAQLTEPRLYQIRDGRR